MDQFKKLYKPVLKAVKPGEKRSPPTATKVDFSKRFAEIIHHQDDNSNEENEESIESNIKLKEDVVDFKPASALKLNLNRPGLLSMPQKMDNDHTGNNNHVDSPTSAITIIDQEESSYIKNIQKKEFIEQPSSAIEFPSDSDEDFTEINASNVNNEKKTNIPMITQNDLDKSIIIFEFILTVFRITGLPWDATRIRV